MFATVKTLSVIPNANSGRQLALAISSAKRSAAAHALPDIAEILESAGRMLHHVPVALTAHDDTC
jgi:hypothetical protein